VSFLLDTDTCSFHLRRSGALTSRFIQHSGRIPIPTIVIAELSAWACSAPNPQTRIRSIQQLLEEFTVLAFDTESALRFGELRVGMKRKGIGVSTPDLMIASVALVHDLTLVTHNTKDFRLIPGLRIEDWVGN
jgi:tRNA(fMet)-specific endonuclease VapC